MFFSRFRLFYCRFGGIGRVLCAKRAPRRAAGPLGLSLKNKHTLGGVGLEFVVPRGVFWAVGARWVSYDYICPHSRNPNFRLINPRNPSEKKSRFQGLECTFRFCLSRGVQKPYETRIPKKFTLWDAKTRLLTVPAVPKLPPTLGWGAA